MRSAEAEKALRAVGITSLLHQCRSKGEKRLFWQTYQQRVTPEIKFSYCLVKFPSLPLILQKVNLFYGTLKEIFSSG